VFGRKSNDADELVDPSILTLFGRRSDDAELVDPNILTLFGRRSDDAELVDTLHPNAV
jgi:hypothetical protein